MKSNRSWIGSGTTIERAFQIERASAPQPSATAQPTATQSDCAWQHWSSDWQKRWGYGEAGMESEEGTAF